MNEFIFGNLGKGYGYIYSGSTRDDIISERMQKKSIFNISLGVKQYAYEVDTDGKSFTAIFNMFAENRSFNRESHYNHVRWYEVDRDYFLQRGFLDNLLASFASQEDIDRLTNNEHSHRTLCTINALSFEHVCGDAPEKNRRLLLNILHGLHSGNKKIVVALDLTNEHNFDLCARKLVQTVFRYLDVNMRIGTSFVVSCNLNSFLDSSYRLCVVPTAFATEQAEVENLSILHINRDFVETDYWAKYVSWIVSLSQIERDEFFRDYDCLIGQFDLNAANLLEYYISLEEGTASLSKLLQKHIPRAIKSDADYVIPQNLRKQLRAFHEKSRGYIMSGECTLDIYRLSDFVDKNLQKLTYLYGVYGMKRVPELEALLEEAMPLKCNGVITETDLNELEKISRIIDEYSAKEKNNNAMISTVYSRAVYYLGKCIANLAEGFEGYLRRVDAERNESKREINIKSHEISKLRAKLESSQRELEYEKQKRKILEHEIEMIRKLPIPEESHPTKQQSGDNENFCMLKEMTDLTEIVIERNSRFDPLSTSFLEELELHFGDQINYFPNDVFERVLLIIGEDMKVIKKFISDQFSNGPKSEIAKKLWVQIKSHRASIDVAIRREIAQPQSFAAFLASINEYVDYISKDESFCMRYIQIRDSETNRAIHRGIETLIKEDSANRKCLLKSKIKGVQKNLIKSSVYINYQKHREDEAKFGNKYRKHEDAVNRYTLSQKRNSLVRIRSAISIVVLIFLVLALFAGIKILTNIFAIK